MADESLGHIDIRFRDDSSKQMVSPKEISKELKAVNDEVAKALKESIRIAKANKDTIADTMKSLREGYIQANMSARQILEYKLKSLNATKEEIKESLRFYDLTKAREGRQSILQKIMNVGRIAQGATKGGGVSGAVSAGSEAASAASAGSMAGISAIAIGVGVVVGTVAVIATTLYGIHKATEAVITRVGELARVDPKMAMVNALNKIAEMRRDMQEAKILGPLYAEVMSIASEIKDALMPIFLIIKAFLTGVLSIALQAIKSILTYITPIIQKIAVGIGGLLLAASEGKTTTLGVGAGLTVSGNPTNYVIGQALVALSGSSKFFNTLQAMGMALTNIAGMIQQATKGPAASNAFFKDMLDALANSTVVPIAPRIFRGPTP